MRVLRLVTFLGILAAAALPLYAQSDTGSIDGRVFDQQKAGMPGVTVTAKNTATGLTRSTVSGTTGTYHFGSLPAGTYDITAEIQGFSTQVRKGVLVQVSSPSTMDITLTVGNLSETVVVTGETPLVQTTKSDVGQVITNSMVENMPLNGRKFQDLSLLVPGTRPANYYDPTKTEVGGISYGGLSGRSVNISVDGGDNNDGVVRGLLQQFSADAIQEYKVTTQRYSAEFGRSTGGLVNVITKSGTNLFRGSGFLFARNDNLNAKTYFEKTHAATDQAVASEAVDKQPFSQQQVGGTVGGPIAKDKAFFFFSYEFNRRNDFAIINTGGVLPAEEGPKPKPFRNHLVTAKTDFQLNQNNRLLVRYALEDQNRKHDFIGGSTLASAGAHNTNMIHSVIAKNSTVMGNSKLNESVFLFQYFENNITAEDNTKPGIITPDFTFGANTNTPQQTIQRRFQIRDDFSFRKDGLEGRPRLQGGGRADQVALRRLLHAVALRVVPVLQPAARQRPERLPERDCGQLQRIGGRQPGDDNWTYVAAYFQDDWKPRSNVTVNMGLRWEMQAGPYQNNFDTPVLRYLKDNGYNSERKQDMKDFGPRIGFAWDTMGNGKTVVRGGYGIYYDEIFQNITLYEKWNDVRTPLYFISLSPAPFTAAFYQQNTRGDSRFPAGPDVLGADHAPDGAGPEAAVLAPVQRGHVPRAEPDAVVRRGLHPRARQAGDSPVGAQHRPEPEHPAVAGRSVQPDLGTNQHGGQPRPLDSRRVVPDGQGAAEEGRAPDDLLADQGDEHRQRLRVARGRPVERGLGSRLGADGQRHSPPGHAGRRVPAGEGHPGVEFVPGEHRQTLHGVPGPGRCAQQHARRGHDAQRVPRSGLRHLGRAGLEVFDLNGGRSFEILFEVFNLTNRVNLDSDVGFNTTYGQGTTPLPNFGKATQIVPNSQFQSEFGVRFKF